MVQLTPKVIYLESDGKPMADNTEQFHWIVLIKENLEILFADDPMIFVAGDLLWYPVEGNNKLCQAPDAMVVFGRPKGRRGSYQQWREGNTPPQVVFEILSPGNTIKEMTKKLNFYDCHGVEEYYLYDPDRNDLSGWLRAEHGLVMIEEMHDWVSPRLGIRLVLSDQTLAIYRPDGEKFLSPVELFQRSKSSEQRATQADLYREIEHQRALRAEQEKKQAQAEKELEHQRALRAEREAQQQAERAERLQAQLLALGIDPDIQPSTEA